MTGVSSAEGQCERRSKLEEEVSVLNGRLGELKRELSTLPSSDGSGACPRAQDLIPPPTPSHHLLLLTDSALPLGSFAYSHGLESYLAHHSAKGNAKGGAPAASFRRFLRLSLSSTASLSIPHLLAAFRRPSGLLKCHTQTYDASLPCAVARRASLAQGRALLAVWERSFRPALSFTRSEDAGYDHGRAEAVEALDAFVAGLKAPSAAATSAEAYLQPQPHYPSLYGVVCRALHLSPDQAANIFLLSHVRSVLSAAVRASVLGPYAAQAVLASREIEDGVRMAVDDNSLVDVADACQGAPVMDIWAGRHEKLYSRIFSS